jgi:hypothetical protein
MASNIASKERKAVAIVSVGSVAIPIYAAPVTEAGSGDVGC